MLSTIGLKGLVTKGIFKKSANKKSCRILKEKLNAGDKVNLEDESVHVVASVLKDFLRNIPGSVFPSSAYVQWLSVPHEENSEERIAAAQRLLEQLPKANDALLRALFRMLHNIQQHSTANHMTAYNLSLCVARSLLSLSTSRRGSELKDQIQKISLMQLLIENFPRIFAEDTTPILEDSSISCDNSHGRPEGTQKSHLKATALLPQEPELPTSTAPPGIPVLPGWFVRRRWRRCPARKEQQTGHQTDERDSLLDGNVQCSPSTGQDTRGPNPPPAKPRQLFGATLTDIYNDHKLPTPIQDFLRNIPGSIFPSSAYVQWLSVPDEENSESLQPRVPFALATQDVTTGAQTWGILKKGRKTLNLGEFHGTDPRTGRHSTCPPV